MSNDLQTKWSSLFKNVEDLSVELLTKQQLSDSSVEDLNKNLVTLSEFYQNDELIPKELILVLFEFYTRAYAEISYRKPTKPEILLLSYLESNMKSLLKTKS